MNPNSSAMQMHLLLRHGKRRRLSPISILLGNNSAPYSFLPAKTCPPSCINLLHSSTILPPIQASALSLLHCSSIPPPFHVAPTLACLPSSILADSCDFTRQPNVGWRSFKHTPADQTEAKIRQPIWARSSNIPCFLIWSFLLDTSIS